MSKSKKRFWIFILLVILLGGICFSTCPKKDAHKDAVKEFVDETLRESLEVDSGFLALLSDGISSLASEMVDMEYHDYYLFSVCKLSIDDDYTYSVGIMNRVIILGKDKVIESLKGEF